MKFETENGGKVIVNAPAREINRVAEELTAKLLATGSENIDYDEGNLQASVFSYSPRDDFGNNKEILYQLNTSDKNSIYVEPLTDKAKSDLQKALF